MSNFFSNWEKFYRQLTLGAYNYILEGLKNTIIIAILGLIIGMLIGSILAIFKLTSKNKLWGKLLNIFADVYVALFRGVPMIVLLLLFKFGLFPTGNPIIISTIAFGLNSGAYVCEIMRGGILSVDIGQTEAGRALGLNYVQTMIRIVIPQAIKNIIPTLGNEFISLLKETSVVSFVAVTDIKKGFDQIANSTLEFMIPYIMLALVYLVIVLVATGIVKLIERRLRAGDRR